MPLPAPNRLLRSAAPALAAAAVVSAVAVGAPVAAAHAAPRVTTAPGYVGIVISGHGYACVRWTPGITGDEVLNDVASVNYRRSDGLILQIDGAPSAGRADADHYWSYWHDTASSWHYSSVGASGYQPAPGSVEGWSYIDGTTNHPPPQGAGGLYASICGGRDVTHRPPPRSSSPARSATGTTARPEQTSTVARSTAAASSAGHTRPASSAPVRPSSAPAASATSSSVPAPTDLSLTPLPSGTAAGHASSGSVLPVVGGLGLALLLGGGAAVTMLRRRRTG